MGFVLYFGVIIANLFYVYNKKNSKSVALISVFALALVMGFAGTQFGDLMSYEQFYGESATAETSRLEPGYIWLNSVFLNMGFSFDAFRTVLFLLGSVLLFFAIKQWTTEYNFVVLLYALALFYFFSVALRFFVGFVIVIFAFRFLWSKKWYHIALYIGLVLLATLFHKSFYVMLLFLVCFLPPFVLKIANRVLLILSGVSMICVLIMLISTDFIVSISGVVMKISLGLFSELEDLSGNYLGEMYSRRYVIYIAFYVLSAFCTWISLRYLVKNKSIDKNIERKMICILLISLTLSMTALMSQTMIRLLFVAVFLGFLVAGRALQVRKESNIPIKAGTKVLPIGSYVVLILASSLTWFVTIYLLGDLGFNLARFLGNNTLL